MLTSDYTAIDKRGATVTAKTKEQCNGQNPITQASKAGNIVLNLQALQIIL